MSAGLTGLGMRRRQSLPLMPIVSALLLLLAVALFIVELLNFSQQEDTLTADITVGGVEVGGLSPSEAVAKWQKAYASPVVLYYENSPILLDPASIGFRTNRDAMLAAARAQSDRQASFWIRFLNHLTRQEFQQKESIPLTADYQQNLLQQFLKDISARYDRPPGKPGYDLQTLTSYPGTSGYVLDIDAAMKAVDKALRDPNNRTVVLPLKTETAPSPNINTLRDLIVNYLDSQGWIYDGQKTVASIFISDLKTGDEVNLLGDVAVSAASTAKVAILIDYFRYLAFAPSKEDAWLMVNSLLCSNNSSSNLIMQIIGGNDLAKGLADVNQDTHYIGARNTFLTAPFALGIKGQQLFSIPAPTTAPNPNFNTRADPFNQTTTEDLGTMFTMIYDCAKYGSGLMAAYPNGEFTQTECQQMLNLMSDNDLLRLLQGGIPKGVRIAHKNGWVSDTHGDAGIVFPPNGHDYVIAVFLWADTDFLDYNVGWPLIEGVSRAAWNYFSPESPLLQPRADVPTAAQECKYFAPPDEDSVDLNNPNGVRISSASPSS
jgi:beta-lactamase class A